MAQALANGAAPYITKLIADTLPDDPVSRTLAHAAVNVVLCRNNAGIQMSEAIVPGGDRASGTIGIGTELISWPIKKD
ncbi:Uncharacterised protein [Yersinia rohdei]|nr:Uncharacterised protein [Yersinia rohdei]